MTRVLLASQLARGLAVFGLLGPACAPGGPAQPVRGEDAGLDGGDAAAEVLDGNMEPDAGDAAVEPAPTCTLSSTPAWTVVGEPLSQLGNDIATIDGDGDGDLDVVLGAWYWRPEGLLTPQGRALLYERDEEGLHQEPDWIAEGTLGDRDGTGKMVVASYLGARVGNAGDVNGDGFQDLLVSEPFSEQDQAGDAIARGRVLLFPGSASGFGISASWTFSPDDARQRLGASAAAAGDVDADGFDDVLVGAHRTGVWGTGRAALFRGAASGLSSEPSWTIEGKDRRDDVGRIVGAAGDLNADGYADVFVASCGPDKVATYLGGPDGLALDPSWTIYGAEGSCGLAVNAGDGNGDGFSDLAVVVLTQTPDLPLVSLYAGGPDGLPLDALATVHFDADVFPLPGGFAGAGDVNGDGFDDLAVFSPLSEPEEHNQGMVAVYAGGRAGWAPDPIWTRLGSVSSERFGSAVATLPDDDVPGCAGLLVTSSLFGGGLSEMGRAEWYPPERAAPRPD